MTEIGVYHPIFGSGGGEAVCMNTIEALQPAYDVTVLTLSDPDFERLNAYYNTTVDPDTETYDFPVANPALNASNRIIDRAVGRELGRLHVGVFGRLARRVSSQFDLVVSTFGEYEFETPSVQYVHFPMYNRHRFPAPVKPGAVRRLYGRLCDFVSGFRGPPDGILLANSDWTAELTERTHGVRPRTLSPPIDTTVFEPTPWCDRENGFVAIGRIEPTKRIGDTVRILNGLEQRGHDVHLHVVGPVEDRAYYDSLRAQIPDESPVRFEGRLSRERLVELIETHRFGLHTKRYEHFGISVAELVAGGAIPFVHDSGGQREIVNEEPRLTYESVEDAVETISWVLRQTDKQRALRDRLPDVEARYGRSRFKDATVEIVESALSGDAR